MSVPQGPTTYAQWLPLLDAFAAGDDAVLETLERGRLEWTNVVAERMVRAASVALRVRLESLTSDLQHRLNRASSAVDVRAALSAAETRLGPLATFSRLPGFEASLRSLLDDECRKWVERTQSSLATSSRAAGDVETRRMLDAGALAWPPPPASPVTSTPEPAPSGRRVLL